MSIKMEFCYEEDDKGWLRLGFWASGGFIPYRYELKADAERTLEQLHPKALRRVVPATSVCVESNGVHDE